MQHATWKASRSLVAVGLATLIVVAPAIGQSTNTSNNTSNNTSTNTSTNTSVNSSTNTSTDARSSRAAEVRRQVDYVNGGISEDDAESLRGRAASFPLEVTFARRTETGYGFAADVRVRIVDATGGVVLSLPSADPILLANLPPGRYTVEATFDGQTKRQQVALGRGHRKVGFTW